MKRILSPPLLSLILLGFFVVSLPLVAAIITATVKVDRFAQANGEALVSVQQNTATGGLLVDRVIEMERSARQYQALLDTAYKTLYEEHRTEVLSLLEQLRSANQSSEFGTIFTDTIELEANANQHVGQTETGVSATELETAFKTLREKVVEIVLYNNNATEQLINAIPEDANQLQNLLFGQAILAIPLSVTLAFLFAFLIARPLRQINQGIRSLGQGSLSEPVVVRGTRDLEELGRQLNLLRLRLIELEAQKAQFLRNVSHELKTPLTNIREGAELLVQPKSNSDQSDSEMLTIAQILKENSLRLQRMIEELLHYGADSDITTGYLEQSVAFDQLIRDIANKQAPAAAARSIKINIKATSASLVGDQKRLEIIVDNLLSNAIKYSPPNGKIELQLRHETDLLILDVRDTGPGISEQDKHRLFDWFYTGAKPQNSIIVGTGMGLAIAQEYAVQMNGEICQLDTIEGAHFRLKLRAEK